MSTKKPAKRNASRPLVSGFEVVMGLCLVMMVIIGVASHTERHRDSNSRSVHQSAQDHTSKPPKVTLSSTSGFASEIHKTRMVVRHSAAGLEDWLSQLRAENSAEEHEEKLRAIIATIRREDIPSLLRAIQTGQQDKISNELAQRLFRRWAETNLAAASSFLAQMPPGKLKNQAVEDVAVLRANANSTEAVAWAEQLPASEEQQLALGTIANEEVRTDPITAATLATKLPAGNPRDELLRRSATEWASTDPQAAVDWIRKIPDDALRNSLLAGAVTAWGDGDPVAAATVALTELPAGRAQSDAVVGIVQRWTEQNPEQAAAWVQQFPAGALRNTAVASVVSIWSQANAAQAKQWLSHLASSQ